jgi:CheY-like chemotaxis protein
MEKTRVLVVDDNIDAAETLGEAIRMFGHEVEVVHDGGSALEVARRFQPAIVFLDIGLPGMDGYEVARRLRSTGTESALVLVAVTGFGQGSDRDRSRAAGFDHHLVKPVDLETVVSVLGQGVPM